MSTFKLFIEMDNEAFQESETREVARILRRIATELENTRYGINAYDREKLRDYNGNTVGAITVGEDNE
jgi:hypothetical protein